MLVGEVSKITGLSRDTIRFYEKKGLIEVERTDSEWNNYKDYSPRVIDRLLVIKKAKSFGFTLNEISDILTLLESNEANCSTMTSMIEDKIKKIDKKIMDLQSMKKMIRTKVANSESSCNAISENANCEMLSIR